MRHNANSKTALYANYTRVDRVAHGRQHEGLPNTINKLANETKQLHLDSPKAPPHVPLTLASLFLYACRPISDHIHHLLVRFKPFKPHIRHTPLCGRCRIRIRKQCAYLLPLHHIVRRHNEELSFGRQEGTVNAECATPSQR